MEKLFVIKIGGNIIDNESAIGPFLSDFSKLTQNRVLIHGGGKVATDISKGLGIEAQMIDGRRVTDAETLKIVTMVYAGLINKKLVAGLQANGTNAIGLTGADANIVLSDKRPLKNGIDYGFVADVKEVSAAPVDLFVKNKLVPVLAPLSHDGKGNMLNTNADTMASVTAVAMTKQYEVHLVYCFELNGVLRDFEDKNSVIEKIDSETYVELKNAGVISKGMIPKLDNSFDAINAGVTSVRICHANDLVAIINDGAIKGTVLVK